MFLLLYDELAECDMSFISQHIAKNIDIKYIQYSKTWKRQLEEIAHYNCIDGVILCQRHRGLLDTKAFSETSLGQEIRCKQQDCELTWFPIVLFSTKSQIELSQEYFCNGLFDLVINNANILSECYWDKIISLSNGYHIILSVKDVSTILGIDEKSIDSRFLYELKRHSKVPNILSAFLISELLEKQGLLIDEATLAARLGIDITSNDWNKLKEKLVFSLYDGVFSKGWPRWWMHLVDKWWNETMKSKESLHATSAKRRMNIIHRHFISYELKTASRIKGCDSDYFWTVCKGCKRPLDPADGLMIRKQENLYPWQEPYYVSVNAVSNGINRSEWGNIAQIEKDFLTEV